jgi:hypothetical protein
MNSYQVLSVLPELVWYVRNITEVIVAGSHYKIRSCRKKKILFVLYMAWQTAYVA